MNRPGSSVIAMPVAHDRLRSRRSLPRSAAGHLVDAYGGGEDERLLLARCDLDAVGLPDPEPALGQLGDSLAAP